MTDDEFLEVLEAEPSPPPQREGTNVAVDNSGDTLLHTSPALEMTPQPVEPLKALHQPVKEETQPIKRGRGRPRKSASASASHPTSLGTESQETQSVKRGRGRPRKTDTPLTPLTLSVPGRTHALVNASSSAVTGPDSAGSEIKLETAANAIEGSVHYPVVIEEIKEEDPEGNGDV